MQDGPDGWGKNITSWGDKIGVQFVDYLVENDRDQIRYYAELFKDVWCIAGGNSPRGKNKEQHCVVWRNDEIIHNPHPTDKRGIETFETITVIIIKNPQGMIFNCKDFK